MQLLAGQLLHHKCHMTSYTVTAHDTQSGMHRPNLTPMHRAQLRGVNIILQDKPDADTLAKHKSAGAA